MGSINGKESEDLYTPPRLGVQRRVLEFDPRSPSTSINRTPILVDKTPSSFLDPRSPTPGIMRTPISSIAADSKQDKVLEDVHVKETEPLILSPSDHQNVDEPVMLTSLMASPMELQAVSDLHSLSLAEDMGNDSSQLIFNDDCTPELKENVGSAGKSFKNSLHRTPKQLFPVVKKSSLGGKDITRSPLATKNIDVNSPRNIVQRKQTKKIDAKMTCGLESSNTRITGEDKENYKL